MAEAQLLYAKEPVIPISLWADAAAKGTDIGNAQKTTGQAIAQGITQGIEGYQKVRENEADIAIKQQAVEQAPLELELKRQQLENEKAITQINMMKAQAEMLTQEQDLKVAKAKAEQELSILSGKSKLDKVLADPNHTKDFLNDPDINAALTSNNDLNKQVFGNEMNRTNADGTPVYTQEEKDAWLGRIDAKEKYKLDQEKALKEQELQAKLAGNLNAAVQKLQEGKLGYIAGRYKLKPEDWVTKIQMDPKGVKTYKEDGTLDESVPDGEQDVSSSDFEVRVLDNGKWRKANVLVKDTEADNWSKYKTAYRHTFGDVAEPPLPQPKVVTPPPGPAERFKAKPAGSELTVDDNLIAAAADGRAPTGAGMYTSSTSNDPITRQKAIELEQKAQSDPDFANRLILKGAVQGVKSAQGIKAKQAMQESAPKGTFKDQILLPEKNQLPTITIPEKSNKEATPVPSPTTPTAALVGPKNVSEMVQTLTPAARKHVEPTIVTKVLSEPLLKNEDSLAKAVAAVESGGNRNAKSPSGPLGLFQLAEATAGDLKVNREDPEQNVKGGVVYLKSLMDRYHGNTVAALMAYNVGMGVVDNAINIAGSSDWESILNGIKYLKSKGMHAKLLTDSKIKEVASYPAKVLAYKEAFDNMTYV